MSVRAPDTGAAWSVELPDRITALVLAARGIVVRAPHTAGRRAALKRLNAGGEDAVMLALKIVRAALS